MKKIKLILSSIGMSLLPVVALATDYSNSPALGSITNINNLVGRVEGLIWIIFGAIALIMFVIAGIAFLTSQGDPEKVATARSAFIWGVAGVVVAVIAYSIVVVVASVMGV